jgi:DHA2 family multidrug resistance protein
MGLSRESKLIVFVAVLASLLEIVDASIVNVAIPTMMGNLGATLEDISMVITGYAIANAIVLPLSGWMSDRIGRRKYYLGCIGIFTITSVACGFAPNLHFLIVFRILQGLAGGALLPTSQALIYEQFPKEKAGIAGAVFGMSVMIGPALGPTLGGYLTDNFGWRSIFNVNLPLGIIALFIGYLVIKTPQHEIDSKQQNPTRTIDSIGLALLALGIGCLQYVLERGEADDWLTSKAIIVTGIIALICLPTFVWWELKEKHPIVNLRLFKDGIVSNGVLLMTMLGFFLYSVIFILPVFVSRTLHYDATQIGMIFIPGSLLTAALMPFIGKGLAKINPKIFIFIGLLAIEACLMTMTQYSPQTSRSDLIQTLYIRGFAMAFLFIPINSSILSQFSGSALGQVSGLLNLSRQIGGSLGIALMATILNLRSHQNYLDLVSNVSMLKPSTQIAFRQSVAGLSNKMVNSIGLGTPTEVTLKSFYYRVQNQVFMMSFLQLVFTIALIFSLSFIPLFLIKFRKVTKAVDAH